MNRIIESLLDTDWYKFTVQRIFFYRFSDVVGEYAFVCRSPGVRFTEEMVTEINRQINELCKLRFHKDEIDFIKSVPYMQDAVGYLEFLKLFQLNRDFITVSRDAPCGLLIRAKGPLWAVSMFEIYVLAIVNEVYFKGCSDNYIKICRSATSRFHEKLNNFYYDPFSILEFGTRRRLSHKKQEMIIAEFVALKSKHFIGTSNVYFSKAYGLKP